MGVVAFVELNSMDMLEVSIWNWLDRHVLVHIVDYHIFIRSANNADMTLNFSVMECKSWDMLRIRVLELLNQFIKATLLESFDVIACCVWVWELKLVKIQLISRWQNYQLVLIVKLSLSYLVCERWILVSNRHILFLSWSYRTYLWRLRRLLTLFSFDLPINMQQLFSFLLPIQIPNNTWFISWATYQVLIIRAPTNGIDGTIMALKRCWF